MPQWAYIVLGVAVFLILVVLLFTNKKFKSFVYQLVLSAEEHITGEKKGNERFEFVISKIREIIPSWLKWFFTEKRIKNIIEWAVSKMKNALK